MEDGHRTWTAKVINEPMIISIPKDATTGTVITGNQLPIWFTIRLAKVDHVRTTRFTPVRYNIVIHVMA